MLWDKRDNFYAEGLTARTRYPAFYHKNEYTQFFISEDWSAYTEGEYVGSNNNTFNCSPKYSYNKTKVKDTTFTYANGSTISMPAVFIATNGYGTQGAVLFKIKDIESDSNSAGSTPSFGFVNAKGSGFINFDGGTEAWKKGVWVLLNLIYRQSSNSYEFTLNTYFCSSKTWRQNKISSDTFWADKPTSLNMPSDYDPQVGSEYFPKFVVYMGDRNYEFSNFFGYSVNISESDAEEIIKNGRIFYSKANGGMYALFYNECTSSDYYPNTTFYHDGTVIPRGELVEGAVNQICKNGDIKSQEFIEY